MIPYVLGSANKDFTRTTDQLDSDADVGVDLKWGVTPNLTLDVTVNTDFAQVEADEEQVNLTRFDLFFPEKRPFFLENASTFQFGQPQSVDLFFSRRIGLSGAAGTLQPIDILGGGRLSGKVAGSWNVGLLNIQTNDARGFGGRQIARRHQLHACCARSGKWAARATARSSSASTSPATDRARPSTSGTAPTASTPTGSSPPGSASPPSSPAPTRPRRRNRLAARQRLLRARASTTSATSCGRSSGGYTQVGERFNPEVGFLPRRGYRRPEFRVFFQPQPKNIKWIRRFAPHVSYNAFWGFDGELQIVDVRTSTRSRSSRCRAAASAGSSTRTRTTRWCRSSVYNRDGNRVVIPPGEYTWWQHALRVLPQPERRRSPARSATASATTTTATSTPRADQRLPVHGADDGQRRLDAAGHRPAAAGRSSPTWCR